MTSVPGKDLKVGDTIAVVGGQYEVTGFEDHGGLDGETARVALYRDDNHAGGREVGITVFDSDEFVDVGGVFWPRHLVS